MSVDDGKVTLEVASNRSIMASSRWLVRCRQSLAARRNASCGSSTRTRSESLPIPPRLSCYNPHCECAALSAVQAHSRRPRRPRQLRRSARVETQLLSAHKEHIRTHRQTRPFRQTIAPSRRARVPTISQNRHRLGKASNAISVRRLALEGRCSCAGSDSLVTWTTRHRAMRSHGTLD